ncbi:MAG: hypothetical protein R2827_00240 [Bdellovibrionales bacterium]
MTSTKFTLEDSKPISANEGFINLKWEGEPPFKLILSKSDEFDSSKALYSGMDTGYFMTGLEEGPHFFKVIGAQGTSDVVQVVVSYPSSEMVIGSLIVGSVLFLSLCAIIFKGNFQSE